MYGKVKQFYTPQGCKVVEVQSVSRTETPDGGEILTPRVDIFLSVPETDVDKANDIA